MKQDNWLATERIKFYHNLFVQWIFNGFYLHFQNTEIMIQNDVFSSQILHGRNSNFVKETKKKDLQSNNQPKHTSTSWDVHGCAFTRIRLHFCCFEIRSVFPWNFCNLISFCWTGKMLMVHIKCETGSKLN